MNWIINWDLSIVSAAQELVLASVKMGSWELKLVVHDPYHKKLYRNKPRQN